ncbi:hypothetical protein NKH19_07080 [Mesorhizobium sp. M1338]|uniref:TOBE domain-containing protein n=1 Tax=unclassified Mesorhizobium TaxID=325217 RepID=UPI00333B52B5
MENSPWFETDRLEACPPIYLHEYNKGRPGSTTSHARIDIGGAIVTAITDESVADLELEKGKQAYAVDKASNVRVGID